MHDIVLYDVSCVPSVVLSDCQYLDHSVIKQSCFPPIFKQKENTVENDTVDKDGDASGWETEDVRSELIIK